MTAVILIGTASAPINGIAPYGVVLYLVSRPLNSTLLSTADTGCDYASELAPLPLPSAASACSERRAACHEHATDG